MKNIISKNIREVLTDDIVDNFYNVGVMFVDDIIENSNNITVKFSIELIQDLNLFHGRDAFVEVLQMTFNRPVIISTFSTFEKKMDPNTYQPLIHWTINYIDI